MTAMRRWLRAYSLLNPRVGDYPLTDVRPLLRNQRQTSNRLLIDHESGRLGASREVEKPLPPSYPTPRERPMMPAVRKRPVRSRIRPASGSRPRTRRFEMMECKMRLIAFILTAFILVAFVASGPAAAQGWKEYSYPDYAFTVAFPDEPKIEATVYQAADGRPAPARVYSATQDRGVFKMTVVDLSNAGLQESAVLDHAVKTLSQGGEIKLDIPHRISRVFGRQLSIQAADGSRSSIAVFYHDGRLYQIEGKALPPGNATSEAIRFQQSLVFTDSD
jgi:hypothetical protein